MTLEPAEDWGRLLEDIARLSCSDHVKVDLLKALLRQASDNGRVRPTDYGSQAAAAHVRDHHDGRWWANCSERLLERAHPVDVAELAHGIAGGSIPPATALEQLSPLVLLLREEHRKVGSFRSAEDLERQLGEPLYEWEGEAPLKRRRTA